MPVRQLIAMLRHKNLVAVGSRLLGGLGFGWLRPTNIGTLSTATIARPGPVVVLNAFEEARHLNVAATIWTATDSRTTLTKGILDGRYAVG